MPEEFEVDPGELVEQIREHQRLTGTEPKDESGGMTRRDLLVKRGGAAAAAVSGAGALAGAAPAAPAKSGAFTGTLRVITLGVEWPTPEVQKKAEADLGFKFALTVTDPVTMVQKAITAPETFDIFGGYNYQYIQMYASHHLLPVDTRKLTAWPQLYKLFAWGKVHPGSRAETYGDGDAPFRALFLKQGTTGLPLTKEGPRSNKDIVQWVTNEATNKTRGPMPRYIVGPPAHFNADSIGYNADVLKKLPNQVGWQELLNKQWKGKVALLKDPGIVMQDVGNALKALGIFKPKDMGNMTRAEIDRVVKVATTYKKAGQFRAYWANFNESVNLMASKEVVVESMWSPAVALLVAQGINVKYANPPTGFRGWCSAQGIAAHVASDPAKLQACYDYINWMYEGWLGATIMRQGYYIGNGATLKAGSRRTARPTRPAASRSRPTSTTSGTTAPARGAICRASPARSATSRRARSATVARSRQRIGHYSSWNSYFTNNAYQVKRWNDFLSA